MNRHAATLAALLLAPLAACEALVEQPGYTPDGGATTVPDGRAPDMAICQRCVVTVAGDGLPGFADGPADRARFRTPTGLALGAGGRIYVADFRNHRVRLVHGGRVTTLAGNGTAGIYDAAASRAQFSSPTSVAVGPAGEVYVADLGNNRIRRIDKGRVSTFAGAGPPGYLDGDVDQALFDRPRAVVVGADGAVYVADMGNHRVRKIAGGQVTTIAGSGTPGGKGGFADGAATTEARFSFPTALAVAPGGGVYVADFGNQRIRLVSGGRVTTVAGGGATAGATGTFADGLALDARFAGPTGLALAADGGLYVADTFNNRIRRLFGGKVTTLTGGAGEGFQDGPLAGARFRTPGDVALDPSGRLFVTDRGNHRVRLLYP